MWIVKSKPSSTVHINIARLPGVLEPRAMSCSEFRASFSALLRAQRLLYRGSRLCLRDCQASQSTVCRLYSLNMVFVIQFVSDFLLGTFSKQLTAQKTVFLTPNMQ